MMGYHIGENKGSANKTQDDPVMQRKQKRKRKKKQKESQSCMFEYRKQANK